MIGVLVSGAGTNLQALLAAGLPVAAVASNTVDAVALERASAAGVASASFVLEDFAAREERDVAMAEWLHGYDVRVVVCAGYMHLLTPSFLNSFPCRVINVHPSLLPLFPGMNAVVEALAAGVATTGVTVHYVDEGVDTGLVIQQREAPILPGDTRETLQARLHEIEHKLLPEVAGRLLQKLGSVATR